MKTLLLLAALTTGLLSTSADAFTGNDPSPCASTLEYKLYRNSARHNVYNLAYASQKRSTITVKVLNAEGKVVKTKYFHDKTSTASLELNKLEKGTYSIEIYSGGDCKVNTETITLE